jgi:hypothetical protein
MGTVCVLELLGPTRSIEETVERRYGLHHSRVVLGDEAHLPQRLGLVGFRV